MLRTNLSTRPFYNERLVHLALALIALIILVLTVLNVVKVVQLSRQNTVQSAKMREDRTAADDYTRKARATRQGINQDELKLVVAAAKEANTLIDSRTFSWTEFFNYVESTLPPDVMLASVRPEITETGTRVTMNVVAKRTDDIQEFMDKLEATGAFENPQPRQQAFSDEGLPQTSIQADYVPQNADVAPPAPAPPAKKPAPQKPAVTGKGASQ
jgi:Tfp pilus assembly protein PilN